MKLLITVVAGALMGVSAMAGKPDSPEGIQPAATASSTEVTVIGPVVEALRSGDVSYRPMRAGRADYVPMRPPL